MNCSVSASYFFRPDAMPLAALVPGGPRYSHICTRCAGVACDHVEGGKYIGPEFLLGGHVYDGSQTEQIVLYRPVYVSVRQPDSPTAEDATTAS